MTENLLFASLLFCCGNLFGQTKTASMQKFEGFFTFYYDATNDKIYLEIKKFNEEFLYVHSLAAGLGNNDIGLDRGQLGGQKVVKFTRSGNKVFLLQPNLDYRAITENQLEKRAVEEAFAQSIIWGFTVDSETENGVLIDATAFFMNDAHQVSEKLRYAGQGNYRVDPSRSALFLPHIKAFPNNVEFEATLTFVGEPQSGLVASVTPSAEAITLREHHSFVRLPDSNFVPRVSDPRAGYFHISFLDYATPIDEPIRKMYICKHRLEKKNPQAAISEAVEPIVYYLDPGVPEPIRSALLEGASWWNQAFEAAGYTNAFQIKMLPEDADPMDVRYNVIQWVHRSTRGWSYGGSVIDPRTGEIIKGHVSLGSLRIRQDYLIAVGLLSPFASDDVPDTMKEMALARIRQLAAHEVGHTLGLEHNYTSSINDRASVMDYPQPYIKITNDKLDFSEAYDNKIGAWDKAAITYGYQDFSAGADEALELNNILMNTYQAQKLSYLSDQDARPQGSAHPNAHLWDNGTNAADELLRMLEVRKIALADFGENSIRSGQPLALLEEALAPIYFYHRYQTEATAKVIGGLYYTYAVRGDGQEPTKMVPAEEQKAALSALLKTIAPSTLALNEELIKLIPPMPVGYSRNRETIKIRTGITFDPITAAEAAANNSISLLLNPARATRLVEYHARKSEQPSLEFVLNELINATFKSEAQTGYFGEIRHAVNAVALQNIFALIANEQASEQARAITFSTLLELKSWTTKQLKSTKDSSEKAALAFTLFEITQFEKDPSSFKNDQALPIPDGSPIGCGENSIHFQPYLY